MFLTPTARHELVTATAISNELVTLLSNELATEAIIYIFFYFIIYLLWLHWIPMPKKPIPCGMGIGSPHPMWAGGWLHHMKLMSSGSI